jgi:RHS repeat-associated protein
MRAEDTGAETTLVGLAARWYCMRARWMDSALGRSISEDPARDGANWLEYCGSSPVAYADPEGQVKELQIPGLPGWFYRIDRPYLAGSRYLQDVALIYKGKDMGSFVIETAAWKHGPHGRIPRGVRGWAKERFGITLECSVIAYLMWDPLDCIAILLDCAGMHEDAAALDRLNGNL